MNNEQLIKKWLNDQLSEEEKAKLAESEEFAQMLQIWEGLRAATPPVIDVDQELQRFRETNKKRGKQVFLSRVWQYASIAAALALVIGVTFWVTQFGNPAGEITITESMQPQYLPDSSVVIINKGSTLTYDSDNWLSERKVRVRGEAYFKVKKGSTFEVVSKEGTVSVLGTVFNVKQRQDFYEVVCFEGKVNVNHASSDHLLTAGKGYRVVYGEPEPFSLQVTEQPDWINGRSAFYRAPYQIVLQELENQYGVIVKTEAIDRTKTFTGAFPNDNLTVALEAICSAAGYTYEVEADQVIIRGEGQR